jgi:hypothetical protein
MGSNCSLDTLQLDARPYTLFRDVYSVRAVSVSGAMAFMCPAQTPATVVHTYVRLAALHVVPIS